MVILISLSKKQSTRLFTCLERELGIKKIKNSCSFFSKTVTSYWKFLFHKSEICSRYAKKLRLKWITVACWGVPAWSLTFSRQTCRWYFYMLPPLLIISIQKIKDTDWFFSVTFLIKEFCIQIVQEACLASSNQKY